MEPEIAPQSLHAVLELSGTMKRHIISAGVTFLSVFLTIFGANLAMTNSMEITGSVLASIAIVAVRAAVKAVVEGLKV